MVKNKHDVGQSQWRKWSLAERALFNNTFESILNIGADLFLHPKTVKRKISDDEFKTIAWNAAWEAADQLRNPGVKTEVVAV